MTEYVVIEGWCVVCGDTLDGQPIDGPEMHPWCVKEAADE